MTRSMTVIERVRRTRFHGKTADGIEHPAAAGVASSSARLITANPNL
jgi:hypothetical protein